MGDTVDPHAQVMSVFDGLEFLPTVKEHTFPVILNSANPEDVLHKTPTVWYMVTAKGSDFQMEVKSISRYDGKIRHVTDSVAVSSNARLLKDRIKEKTQWSEAQVKSLYLNGKKVTDRFVFKLNKASRDERPFVVCGEGESYDRQKWRDVPVVQKKRNGPCVLL
uniref:Uncharacterized protein n=1 Tax=Chromera velia CCMP2878 TaxID=1169474 RepID=A0A0G4G814_9ALVE|mmetsp:Transcript_18418/g.37270  ORF Transcript_18418/g.37270 Transcript_18418/m.37270 type:complete len:164 (+) Transcript_18418:102-593(+)|eukprot:Cvel_4318.t1-p1 / transcript=Cvel_4318.t1 / gene=Cvel_4318 / organism=Chromera_velia_CCMP2878 / gene_product=hypothetical protein / transcript_product=hypothetical protein / location=Cvel_scaffold187:54173-54661(+) / protein_length=163 / sequence_SO=supercontig / SO=protein_coding / is_pseudo=false